MRGPEPGYDLFTITAPSPFQPLDCVQLAVNTPEMDLET